LAEKSPGRACRRAKSGAILPRSQIRARRTHRREMLIVVKPFCLSGLRRRGPYRFANMDAKNLDSNIRFAVLTRLSVLTVQQFHLLTYAEFASAGAFLAPRTR
jgi:hypothetical protein